jgi:putative hydrolase of the HAD superfamily
VKAVFFDVGETLIHPWPSVGKIYADVAKRHGFAITPEQADCAFHESWRELKQGNLTVSRKDWWRELVVRTLGRRDELCFEDLYATFAHAKAWRVYPDVRLTLHVLRSNDLHIGVISNWDERLDPLLVELGLAELFDSITISWEVGVEKPRPEIFEFALQTASVRRDQAIHVGD